jgi:predicted nucleotidyltransferase
MKSNSSKSDTSDRDRFEETRKYLYLLQEVSAALEVFETGKPGHAFDSYKQPAFDELLEYADKIIDYSACTTKEMVKDAFIAAQQKEDRPQEHYFEAALFICYQPEEKQTQLGEELGEFMGQETLKFIDEKCKELGIKE